MSNDIQKKFVFTNAPFALRVEKEFGISATFSLGQSALETGWGANAPGNAMFGVKDTDGINGNEQLLPTTEYHDSPNMKYPFIYNITQVIKGKLWRYKVKDWFRKYPTPYESFRDHAVFLQTNKRYKTALVFKSNPYLLAQKVVDAGYATADKSVYLKAINSIMADIETIMKENAA